MEENKKALGREGLFADVAIRILEADGFVRLSVPTFQQNAPELLMRKDNTVYFVEIRYSRKQIYTNCTLLSAVNAQMDAAKKWDWRPLVVLGAVMEPSLRGELAEICLHTAVIDLRNLLYMAQGELRDELVCMLPYPVIGLEPSAPELMPMPNGNESCGEGANWRVSTLTPTHGSRPESKSGGFGTGIRYQPDDSHLYKYQPDSGFSGNHSDNYVYLGNPGIGKSQLALQLLSELSGENRELRHELEAWQGGRHASQSAQYEKLCTRTLKRLFADDLTLWNEQAISNNDLYRFDLICKIKRDNHKDFWEMAERYFDSKYIIFEFKNYAKLVTQKEVYTTVRYLYPTALRRVAVIISPNGIDDHADKAIRGVLRDEGKLILSLTNEELIHMLQMKECGEDPADYLSDKLDELLIDLEK